MGLRDLHSIDIMHEPPPFETEPCKLVLIVIDATALDDQTRHNLLVKKLTGYVAYLISPDFAAAHPALTPSDAIIRVLTVKPPSASMLQISALKTTDGTHRVRVFFEDYHQYMGKVRGGDVPSKPSNN